MQLDEKALAAAFDAADYAYTSCTTANGAFNDAICAAITVYLAALPPESPAQQPATDAVEGWKLVPAEPTIEMLREANNRVAVVTPDGTWALGLEEAKRTYQAMVAAAPALSQSPAKAGDSLQQRPAAEEKRP